ncbi:hypothetical protein PoB_004072600, partial [Plakobranchus ocellatus]
TPSLHVHSHISLETPALPQTVYLRMRGEAPISVSVFFNNNALPTLVCSPRDLGKTDAQRAH